MQVSLRPFPSAKPVSALSILVADLLRPPIRHQSESRLRLDFAVKVKSSSTHFEPAAGTIVGGIRDKWNGDPRIKTQSVDRIYAGIAALSKVRRTEDNSMVVVTAGG